MDLKKGVLTLMGWAIVVAIVAPFVLYAYPSAIGAEDAFIVQSGSMQPAIPIGAVVFARAEAPEELVPGDVITYQKSRAMLVKNPVYITHRITDVRVFNEPEGDSYQYRTKGDANDDEDPAWIRDTQVVGEVFMTIPYIGYLLDWANTKNGFLLIVVVPASILILNEGRKIYREIKQDSN